MIELSLWVHEELWVKEVRVILWPLIPVSHSMTISNIFKSTKPAVNKFNIGLPWWKKWKYAQTIQVTRWKWPPPHPFIYGKKKLLKIFFSGIRILTQDFHSLRISNIFSETSSSYWASCNQILSRAFWSRSHDHHVSHASRLKKSL